MNKKILGIIWIVIALGLFALLWKGISQRNGGLSFKSLKNWDSIHIDSDGIEINGDKMSGKLTYEEVINTQNLEKIKSDIKSEGLTIIKTDEKDTDIKVQYFDEAEKNTKISLSKGILSVVQTEDFKTFFSIKNPSVIIYIPDVKLTEVDADTTSGAIRLSNIKAESLTATASSGAIKLDKVEAETAVLKAKSGAIKADDTSFTCLKTSASSGAIKINGNMSQIEAETTSGAIFISNSSVLESDSSFKATSGAIKLNLTPSDEYYFETSTTSGSVKNSLSSNRNGSVVIKATASSGAIRITEN